MTNYGARINIIDHDEQRYPTTGDWDIPHDEKNLFFNVNVSKMRNWRYEMLVGIHELIEAVLCKHAGISEQAVTDFDVEFEKNRKPGDDSEPGDDPRAPYFHQHSFATYVERKLAVQLDVDWDEYEAANERLYDDGRVRSQDP